MLCGDEIGIRRLHRSASSERISLFSIVINWPCRRIGPTSCAIRFTFIGMPFYETFTRSYSAESVALVEDCDQCISLIFEALSFKRDLATRFRAFRELSGRLAFGELYFHPVTYCVTEASTHTADDVPISALYHQAIL